MRPKESMKSNDDARGLGTDGAGKLGARRESRPRVKIRDGAPRLFRAGSRTLRFGRL